MELIINTKGTTISIYEGRFKIQNAGDTNMVALANVTSIAMHRGTKLTYEVVRQAIDNNIDILFIDGIGKPIGRLWSNKFGSIATIRKNQILFAHDEDEVVQWVQQLLCDKIQKQEVIIALLNLRTNGMHEQVTIHAISKLRMAKQKIENMQQVTIKDDFAKLRAWEGNAAEIYFTTVSNLLPEQYAFEKRTRQPALDMFNSLLNYAYGIMYARVETSLIEAGIDPYTGIFHRDEYNRPVLTYDIIEKYRHWADYVVIDLCLQQAIFIEFFDINNGAFYLNDFGKKILITAFNDYMDEIIEYDNNSRSRINHMKIEAQNLAQKFKNYKL